MDSLIAFLAFTQVLGATVGACMSVWGELAYLKAVRDGRLSDAEREYLYRAARGLRYGMLLLLLSSFGLVLAAYAVGAAEQPGFTATYWILVSLALIALVVTWGLSRRRVSFWLGSAAVFTSWWFLVYLTLGSFSGLSYSSAVACFVVATVILGGVLQYVRLLAAPRVD